MALNVSAAAAYSRPKNPKQIISQALLEISVKAQHGSEVTTQASAYRDTNPNSLQSFSELALILQAIGEPSRA